MNMILNPCGRLNLKTGVNKHFALTNEGWDHSPGARLMLVKTGIDRYRVVGGWGWYDVGSDVTLYTNRHRYMADGRVVANLPCSPESRDRIREWLPEGSNTVLFYTLD